MMGVPIVSGGQQHGVFVLETQAGLQVLNQQDLKLAQAIAALIGLGIERVSNYQKPEWSEILSHQLNMPLTAIKGYASALLIEEIESSHPKRIEFSQLIEEECFQMESLLAVLLNPANLEQNQLSLELQTLSLPETARQIAEEMERRTDKHHLIVDFPTPKMRVKADDINLLAINFHELLNRTDFPALLSRILNTLEKNYHSALDMEFTVNLPEPHKLDPPVHIAVLQCRPQSYLEDILPPRIPDDLPEGDILLSTSFMVPRGYLTDIKYVLFIKPGTYFGLATPNAHNQISQTIARLNNLLEKKSFICIGSWRWGSTNQDLGVYVSYADIHNTAALIELSGREIGTGPEPSLGTHFFQDLMKAHIYPLAVPLDDKNTRFNRDFFSQAPNIIQDLIDTDNSIADCVQLIDIDAFRPGHHIELIMDDAQDQAIAFLVKAVSAGDKEQH